MKLLSELEGAVYVSEFGHSFVHEVFCAWSFCAIKNKNLKHERRGLCVYVIVNKRSFESFMCSDLAIKKDVYCFNQTN